jgi:hypothetical protein
LEGENEGQDKNCIVFLVFSVWIARMLPLLYFSVFSVRKIFLLVLRGDIKDLIVIANFVFGSFEFLKIL